MEQVKLSKEDMKKIHKQDPSQQPKKKIGIPTLIFRVLEVLIGIAYIVILAFGRFFLPQNNDFVKSFDIFSGVNPMPIARILSYALFVVVAGTILRIVINGLSRNKTITKKTGVAVIQLFGNLVKYLIFIIIICLALSALGVDTAAIFAGLGIVALIIGLGVTSLIEDIVAGIFIIAEHLFDVGDIIVLDGFRGSVVSIGIRSTKLSDVAGNILTLRNSSIGSVVNLTDRPSCAAITIPIAPEVALTTVEDVIKNGHIENIKEKCDKMTAAPIYLGLCEITKKGVQMLLFIAPCKEDYRYDVERALFKNLKIMFEESGIKLGNAGVVVEDEE